MPTTPLPGIGAWTRTLVAFNDRARLLLSPLMSAVYDLQQKVAWLEDEVTKFNSWRF